ncbi:trafficking protein particle complex subunit 10 [Microplitis demolitor]|uniref:trafficking protein particle complex subunit 10 n=1 Tax=Microplitis demolitor TaxID=69319 RepID=UPI0004CCBE01|nr:trafficking protein particle complex subunit 10 [Microplitis demolitor]
MNENSLNDKESTLNVILENKSIVTYAGDEALFLSVESNILNSISSNTVEWRRSFSRPVKSVRLKVSFVPFSINLLSSEIDENLMKQPILHTYWSDCSDLEAYKVSLKDNIGSWLKILNQRQIQDWMIVLVDTYDNKKTNKLIPRTTVLDKIHNDFAAKHGDRCLSVINPAKFESRSAESWKGLISRIQHFMLVAYDKQLIHFEEIIREQRERRNQKDWSFCEYFILQEELAFVLEMLGISDEALVQYDELDALFTQFILNCDVGETPPWLTTFKNPLNDWRAINLKKNVDHFSRGLIRDNKASLLDFRNYLFSRQCALLLSLKQPWEIARRCLLFVYNTLSELRILEVSRPNGSVECWSVLCALEILHICQSSLIASDHSQYLDLCSLYTAGLWALASEKLGKLGKLCGLMPGMDEPTSEQLHTVVYLISGLDDMRIQEEVTYTEKFKSALSSKEIFTKQLLEYSELAMGTYKHIGRIRSARHIGKELAQFYGSLNEKQTAIAFLLDALKTYNDENWILLVVQTQLKLAQYYKEMSDFEKYVKMCCLIACSKLSHIAVRKMYFEEMLMHIKMMTIAKPLCTQFDNCFEILNINVSIIDKNIEDFKVNINVSLKSLLPMPIDNVCAIISVEKIQDITHGMKMKCHPESPITLLSTWNRKRVKPTISQLTQLEVYSYVDLREDKTTESAGIINKHTTQLISQVDSEKSMIVGDKIINEVLAKHIFDIKSGENNFTISILDHKSGIYKINQLSLLVNEKLKFQSGIITPQLNYKIIKTQPSILMNSRNLVTGLIQNTELIISNGSVKIQKGTKIKLWTSRGLMIKLVDSSKNLSSEVEVELSEYEPWQVIKLQLQVYAELPPKKDSSSMEYELHIQPPWGIEESIFLTFDPPLMSCLTIHTIKERKFLQIIVTGLTKKILQLTDPELILNTSVDISFKSLNPIAGQKVVITDGIKVSYLWEMKLGKNHKTVLPLKIDFTMKYFLIENKDDLYEFNISDDPLHINKLLKSEKSSYTYRCHFEISNYASIYTVTSKVKASGNAGEFCRSGSICHLYLNMIRILPGANINISSQVMYEVLDDQSMWAICGRTAGIITFDTYDEQSVTLDIMPLKNGYLPLPIVRLSRYIPALETKNDMIQNSNLKTGPRLEPFSVGQIYNASKAQQVHVLPAYST